MRREIREKYDLTADIYNMRYSELQFYKYQSALADLHLSGRILDHGCGTGLLAQFLSSKLFGVDCSFGMLKKATKYEIVVQADVEQLPFKDRTFDWALSFTVLQNCAEPEHALAELARVAKSTVLTYLNKFDFTEQIKNFFEIVEVRAAGEDVCFILASRV